MFESITESGFDITRALNAAGARQCVMHHDVYHVYVKIATYEAFSFMTFYVGDACFVSKTVLKISYRHNIIILHILPTVHGITFDNIRTRIRVVFTG